MENTKFREWIKNQYSLDEMKEIANHGCSGGSAHGAIYYHETTKLHDEHEDEIWDSVSSAAEEHGQEVLEFISSLNGSKYVGSVAQFKNLLVWYYIESVAFERMEEHYEENK